MSNSNKIILDLCGGTGSWSKPYKDAGYDVYNITLPDYDVKSWRIDGEGLKFYDQHTENDFRDRPRLVVNPNDIYGILAAPPCTMFSLARTRAKKPRDLDEGMKVVKSCLELIWAVRKQHKLAFWALENPMGYLRQFLGLPPFRFDPWEFGEPYTKKTELWGYFKFPKKKFTSMEQIMTPEQIAKCKTNSRRLPSISEITGSKQSAKRAITPAGFAKAFMEANK